MGSPRTLLLTGGSRGIGRTVAQHFVARGYRVFATSRDANAAIAGVEMLVLTLADADSVENCVQEVLRRAGRIDVLVNNAGYDLYGALEETDWSTFMAQIDTNFLGAVRVIKAVLPHMRERGGGRIVNVGSLGGLIALPMNSAYAASKFALEGLSESLRLELRPHGVFVSLIEPGAVATDTLDRSIREVDVTQGPFATRRAAVARRMRAEGATSRTSMQHVALAVQHAAESRQPRLRYPVGAQAVWTPRLKAWLPEAWFEAAMRRMFG